jgi:hypothetical protein
VKKPLPPSNHAGRPDCVAAEQQPADAIDPAPVELEVVHRGEPKTRIAAAEALGIQSVPALVIDAQPFHVNVGAGIAELSSENN